MMCIINKHNYEEYALDYLDGKLSEKELTAMEIFLSKNPEIKAEIGSVKHMTPKPNASLRYPHKSKLKKTATSDKGVFWRVAAVIVLLLLASAAYFMPSLTQIRDGNPTSTTDRINQPNHEVVSADFPSHKETIKDKKGKNIRNLHLSGQGKKNASIDSGKRNHIEINPLSSDYSINVHQHYDEQSDSENSVIPFRMIENSKNESLTTETFHPNDRSSIAIEPLQKNERSHLIHFEPKPLKGPEIKSRDTGIQAIEQIAVTFDSIKENINPYVEFAEENGLISEGIDNRNITLKSIAQTLIPESF